LIDWEKQSSFGQALGAHGGVWECPDLFPLEDQNGNRKWVLLVSINPGGPQGGSATQYFVGDFDGQSFTPQDDDVRWMDWGSDNYAGVTFSDLPETGSNRILMGWMSNWAYANQVPTQPWRSALTLPRSLWLYQQENQRYVLQSAVIDAVDSLLGPLQDLQPEQSNALGADTIKLTLEVQPDTDWSVELSNPLGETFKVYHQEGQIRIDRSQSGDNQFSDAFAKVMQIPLQQVTVKALSLYIDRSSVELFVNDKALVATNLIFPTVPFDQVKLDKIKAGKQQIISSIW
jgi:fructan beta-fructosidase